MMPVASKENADLEGLITLHVKVKCRYSDGVLHTYLDVQRRTTANYTTFDTALLHLIVVSSIFKFETRFGLNRMFLLVVVERIILIFSLKQ